MSGMTVKNLLGALFAISFFYFDACSMLSKGVLFQASCCETSHFLPKMRLEPVKIETSGKVYTALSTDSVKSVDCDRAIVALSRPPEYWLDCVKSSIVPAFFSSKGISERVAEKTRVFQWVSMYRKTEAVQDYSTLSKVAVLYCIELSWRQGIDLLKSLFVNIDGSLNKSSFTFENSIFAIRARISTPWFRTKGVIKEEEEIYVPCMTEAINCYINNEKEDLSSLRKMTEKRFSQVENEKAE
ncbi:MAG: hypothetical protein LBT90_00090 [Holosporaceae bacterium]|jgi:hypothetical protein|nr:hypothetical protein [Holosporaceae bacterium]